MTSGEKSEGEESQQRSVGVGCKDVNSIDERCGVDGMEQENKDYEDEADDNMHTLA